MLHRTTADRTGSVTRGRSLLLGLAAPEPVLTIGPGEVAAGDEDGALGAHLAGRGLAADAALGALAGDAEEEVGAPLAGGLIHPFGTIGGEGDRLHRGASIGGVEGVLGCVGDFSAKSKRPHPGVKDDRP